MRLGMSGPYRLDTATINANVAKASAGNYVLGREARSKDIGVVSPAAIWTAGDSPLATQVGR